MRALGIVLTTPFGLITLAIFLGEKELTYLQGAESVLAACVMLLGNNCIRRGQELMLELDRRKEYGNHQDLDRKN